MSEKHSVSLLKLGAGVKTNKKSPVTKHQKNGKDKRLNKTFPTISKPQISSNKNEKKIKKLKKEILGQTVSVKVAEEHLGLNDLADLTTGSISKAKETLSKLLNPIKLELFFDKYWEKEPLLIKRNAPKYFEELMSIKTVDQILRNNNLEFTKNIDVTSYVDGVRETHNPDGRALPPSVWEFYEQGCSLRLLDPHTYIPNIYKLCAILQELFHSRAGANVYLTPKSSQGFAPHYDDIEAFVLQVEGKKHWRVYRPRHTEEILPRESSTNFTESEIGAPILETTLEPGDLLYFPRGFIHQANTVDGFHSLHITLSVYQKQSIGDYLKLAVTGAIERAIAENVSFRTGLPLNFFTELGLVYNERESVEKKKILENMNELLQTVVNYADLDAAADQMAKKYQHEALPPLVTAVEKNKTVYGDASDSQQITENSKVRLLKANILRLVNEEEVYRLYFHNDNSMTFQEKEPTFIEILDEDCPIIDFLIQSYPKFTVVKTLPHDEEVRKVEVIQDLFDRGFLMVQ